VLRHGYDTVSDRRVWATVEHDLPPLVEAVQAMPRELERP
jgi:uncharacterized protein with HEPN domain